MFYVTGQLYQFKRSEYYYLFGPQTANLHNNWYKKAAWLPPLTPASAPSTIKQLMMKNSFPNLHKINIGRTYFLRKQPEGNGERRWLDNNVDANASKLFANKLNSAECVLSIEYAFNNR